jgi:hypothetical protein
MEFGLYLIRLRAGFRRVVSEGSITTSLLIVSVVQPIARWNFREFPAYSQIFIQNLLWKEGNRRESSTQLRQQFYLRTVPVC